MDISEDKLCRCCGTKKPAGQCIINGVRRNLPDTCRYCFTRHPDEKEVSKRSQVHYSNKE